MSHQDPFKAPGLSKKGKENHDKIDWSKKAKKNVPTPDGLPKADIRDADKSVSAAT